MRWRCDMRPLSRHEAKRCEAHAGSIRSGGSVSRRDRHSRLMSRAAQDLASMLRPAGLVRAGGPPRTGRAAPWSGPAGSPGEDRRAW